MERSLPLSCSLDALMRQALSPLPFGLPSQNKAGCFEGLPTRPDGPPSLFGVLSFSKIYLRVFPHLKS